MSLWDERKNKLNQRRHGISFETAELVFCDSFSVTAEDYVDQNGEMRYQTIGSIEGVVVFVAHVSRVIDGLEIDWLISARKAIKYEEEIYWSRQAKG